MGRESCCRGPKWGRERDSGHPLPSWPPAIFGSHTRVPLDLDCSTGSGSWEERHQQPLTQTLMSLSAHQFSLLLQKWEEQCRTVKAPAGRHSSQTNSPPPLLPRFPIFLKLSFKKIPEHTCYFTNPNSRDVYTVNVEKPPLPSHSPELSPLNSGE